MQITILLRLFGYQSKTLKLDKLDHYSNQYLDKIKCLCYYQQQKTQIQLQLDKTNLRLGHQISINKLSQQFEDLMQKWIKMIKESIIMEILNYQNHIIILNFVVTGAIFTINMLIQHNIIQNASTILIEKIKINQTTEIKC
ncbi:hypothetical protein pb186bvf_008019 [Paramecium bursaria]